MDHLVVGAVVAFVLGAAVGSFLNVVIHRLPRGLSVLDPPRSFCPSCKATIPWYRNVPLVTWVAQNGRCAGCGASIPVVYFVVELAVALLFAAAWWRRFAGGAAPDGPALVGFAADATFAALLVAIAVIDFRHALIPDPLTVPWLPPLVAAAAVAAGVPRGRLLDASQDGGLGAAAAGALAGILLGAMPALLVDFLRRERPRAGASDEPESALPDEDEAFDPAAEMREFLLPVLAPALAAAVVGAFVAPRLGLEARPALAGSLAAAAGGGAGLLLVYAVRAVFSLAFGREAMGLGDAKFLALAGVMFGAEGTLLVFLLASGLGAVPALFSLLLRLPLATCGLLLAVALPFLVLEPLVRATERPGAVVAAVSVVPLAALLLFLRRLRRGDVALTAMPFGPFLVVASLVLLFAWQPLAAAAGALLAPFASR